MKIYAHRGASRDAPENTLQAFSMALDQGVDGIELDCYRAKDGSIVVIHDDTLDRTTDATGPVKNWTAAELRDVDAGGGEHVPTLEEVLALTAGRMRVNIEIKDPDAVDGVISATAAFEDLDWFVSSGHWTALKTIHEQAGAEVYPLTIGAPENSDVPLQRHAEQASRDQIANLKSTERSWSDAVEFGKRLRSPGISISERNITPEIISAIHEAGMEAWVWTINEPVRALDVAAMGADAICTDTPAEILAAREAETARPAQSSEPPDPARTARPC